MSATPMQQLLEAMTQAHQRPNTPTPLTHLELIDLLDAFDIQLADVRRRAIRQSGVDEQTLPDGALDLLSAYAFGTDKGNDADDRVSHWIHTSLAEQSPQGSGGLIRLLYDVFDVLCAGFQQLGVTRQMARARLTGEQSVESLQQQLEQRAPRLSLAYGSTEWRLLDAFSQERLGLNNLLGWIFHVASIEGRYPAVKPTKDEERVLQYVFRQFTDALLFVGVTRQSVRTCLATLASDTAATTDHQEDA